MQEIYFYGMRLRGFSPGCQPMDGLIECLSIGEWMTFYEHNPLNRRYHNILRYNRKLTEKECQEYELDFITSVK